MRIPVLFVAFIAVASCVTTAPKLSASNADIMAEPQQPAQVSAPESSGKHYVPKISLHGEVDTATVATVMMLMDASLEGKAEAIILEINTPGGSVTDGFVLAKAIEESPVPVICVVDGDADSMGFYLLQSCSLRVMTKRSVLMAHEPAMTGLMGGPEVAWKNVSEALKVMTKAMIEHMSHRMTCTPAEMSAKIARGAMWWFDWHEALEFKAVDGVVESVGAVTESYRENLQAPQLQVQP